MSRIAAARQQSSEISRRESASARRGGARLAIEIATETTLRLVWRGETWPKFTVALTGDIDAVSVITETLGAACAVTIRPSG